MLSSRDSQLVHPWCQWQVNLLKMIQYYQVYANISIMILLICDASESCIHGVIVSNNLSLKMHDMIAFINTANVYLSAAMLEK